VRLHALAGAGRGEAQELVQDLEGVGAVAPTAGGEGLGSELGVLLGVVRDTAALVRTMI
jgi:hypothetical protein